MKYCLTLCPITLSLILCSLLANADQCLESKTIEKQFPINTLQQVELKALAGYLKVSPSKDENIHFFGKVCTDTVKHLDMISLDVIKKGIETGDNLTLAVIIPYHQDDFDPDYAYMDIELEVPVSLNTLIRDSSGDMSVEGVSVISIEDSSGDVRVNDGKANLSIRDSSGRIVIRDNEGNLLVSDSSGDIDVRGITGDVEVPGDSSGDIEIERVSGSINIDRDGSGDISIEGVGRDVHIGRDGSGDIDIQDVKGMVTIDADGSGGVAVEDVAGNFQIRNKGSGEIRTHRINGEILMPGS
jgi:hypothetical protein